MKGAKRLKIFWGNLRPVLGKLVSSFFDKKNDPLYNIQCSYHVLRYSIVYFNENCQAAITFNNIARYLDFGRVASKDFVA